MRFTKLIIIVFGFLCITNYVFSQQHNKDLKNQVRQIADITMQANIDGDVEKLYSYYVEDAVSMPNYGPIIRGKDALIEQFKVTREVGLVVHSMSSFIIDVYDCGNIVVETGTYGISLTLPDSKFSVSDTGKYMTLYEKQSDGSLKIKSEIWNTDMNPWMTGN